MRVADIYDEVKKIFGVSDKSVVYQRLTDAITLISNESDWDSLIGYMTLGVDTDGLITLPYDVDKPMALNVDGFPTFPRSKWFEFHLNGPGKYSHIDFYKKFWDDKLLSPLSKVISSPLTFDVSSSNPADNGLEVILYGLDSAGNELTSDGVRGLKVAIGATTSVSIMEVSSVYKPETQGVISLKDGIDLYGEYQPFETEPMYKRIKVPASSTVTMMYRRRIGEIKSDFDFIFINRLSLMAACRSIRFRETDRVDLAIVQQQDAVYLATKEQEARDVHDSIGFQTIDFSTNINESLYDENYGYNGC